MSYTTIYNGIYFIEGDFEYIHFLSEVKADLSFRIGSHFKNLNDIKNELSKKAINLGANAIIKFKYGQKSRWLAIDDVAFYGSGEAVLIETNKLNNMSKN